MNEWLDREGNVLADDKDRRYRNDAEVRTPEWDRMSTVVGAIESRDDYETRFGAVPGTGPLYVVNEGNVFSPAYEAVYSESGLQYWTDEGADQ